MLLLLDNYDSFVHNLARYVQELGMTTQVIRSDALSVSDVARLQPDAIILSPGPCTPAEAGICIEVIQQLGDRIPMLGVCLGHQALGAAFGAEIVRAPLPVHGSTALISHSETGLFADCPNPMRATRYHSLIVDEASLPADLTVTARNAEGLIMGLAHRTLPLYGVQFHPESILTESGHQLLANFLTLAGCNVNASIPEGDQQFESAPAADFFSAPISPDAVRPL